MKGYVYDAEAFWLLSHAITRESVEEWTRRRDAWRAKQHGPAQVDCMTGLRGITWVDADKVIRECAAQAGYDYKDFLPQAGRKTNEGTP